MRHWRERASSRRCSRRSRSIGLVLSIVGVYGLLAQLARNRTREMGIRLALGSPQSRRAVARGSPRPRRHGGRSVHRRRSRAAGYARHEQTSLPDAAERSGDDRWRCAAARRYERARVVAAGGPGQPRRPGERAARRLGRDGLQVGGGTRSSGGTKFERKSRSSLVRMLSPFALILSRMRFTSSRFTSWIDVGLIRL